MDYKAVAKQFCDYYYGAYNGHLQNPPSQIQRPHLANLYAPQSLLTNQLQELMGTEKIMNYIWSESLSHHVKSFVNMSAQPSVGNSIIIVVQGESFFLNDENQTKLPFTETFLIAMNQQNNGFIIFNQIFSTQGI